MIFFVLRQQLLISFTASPLGCVRGRKGSQAGAGRAGDSEEGCHREVNTVVK